MAEQSLAKGDGPLNKLLLAQLECPVCFRLMAMHIEQCKNGHLICYYCRQMVTTCPVCREELTNIRSYPMERVASRLIFPCRFSVLGCLDRLPLADKARHELHCEYRAYLCPFFCRCSWWGTLKNVCQHRDEKHSNVVTKEGSQIIFEINSTTRASKMIWVMMTSCYGWHFVLSLTMFDPLWQDQMLWVQCRIVGRDEDAAQFFYRVALMDNGEQLQLEGKAGTIERKYQKTDVVFHVPVNEEIDSARDNMKMEVTVIKGQMEEQSKDVGAD
ncbi:hypothetical protein KR084_001562 [Drosophila pseudotakahashii]|nr:hypothetical protein KR084_001562 [Drosophila pseudotakahashii]